MIDNVNVFNEIVKSASPEVKASLKKGLGIPAEQKAELLKRIAADINPEVKAALQEKMNPSADKFLK